MMNKYQLNQQELEKLNRQIIEQYCKYYDISNDYNITPEFQNNEEWDTIAMWLTKNQCLIPKYWMHNYEIKNKNGKTLKDLMIKYELPIPQEWQDESKMSTFDQAYFGIIPDIKNHKPEEQDANGFTVAMILTTNKIMPPKQWMHDYDIKNKYDTTLKHYLEIYHLPVPYHWNDQDMDIFDKACYGEIPDIEDHTPDEQNEGGQTVAMILAMINKEIPAEWQHDPKIQDNNGYTVAMYQALKGKIPDKQWEHDPGIQNGHYYTVAMFLADNGIIPPKEWQHDPLLKDSYDNTVAIILTNNNILPPKEWEHIIVNYKIYNDSSEQLLLDNGYKKIENLFIPPHFQIFETSDDTCQICFNDEEQNFIKTTCGHIICFKCFMQLVENINYKNCPICKRQNWTYIQQFDQRSDNEVDNSDSNDSTDSSDF